MVKVLIIGGTGYIGSKLYLFLRDNGYPVDTVDLEWYGNVVNSNNLKQDYKLIDKEFIKRYQVIILLAGHSTVEKCATDPVGAMENNVINFVNLVEKLNRTQKFIYASTFRLYGNTGSGKVKVKENAEIKTTNTYYDLTKKTIDNYSLLSSASYYALRMATVNGFSPNFRIKQVINEMYFSAKKKKRILIYNSFVKCSILGIDDFCRSVRQIIEGDGEKGIYNLASFTISIKEIADFVGRVTNIKVEELPTISVSKNTCISTKKFERNFNFSFRDDLESIVHDLSKIGTHNGKLIKEK